ncbi:hypothetical protein Vretimale_18944 [Volvox reticuliferus]|uniref:Uncharacterized protein n=1 Tax=Volvox reticuliferus TaxID=1737510 RepID=A0A8J4GYY9_9CHLO|nr:hypothetical protein Vretifemale_17276 [Volvox reticuliferus]GIM16285.1 hypothetical protein Vretimale_18944 [Volvox reticuliferus]
MLQTSCSVLLSERDIGDEGPPLATLAGDRSRGQRCCHSLRALQCKSNTQQRGRAACIGVASTRMSRAAPPCSARSILRSWSMFVDLLEGVVAGARHASHLPLALSQGKKEEAEK